MCQLTLMNFSRLAQFALHVGINTNYTSLGVVVGYDTCFSSSVLLIYGTRCHPLLISSLQQRLDVLYVVWIFQIFYNTVSLSFSFCVLWYVFFFAFMLPVY